MQATLHWSILIALAAPVMLSTSGCAGVGALIGRSIDGPREGVDSLMVWRGPADPGERRGADSSLSAPGLAEVLRMGAPERGNLVLVNTGRDSLLADGIRPDTILALKGIGADSVRLRLMEGAVIEFSLRNGPLRRIAGRITRVTREGIFLNTGEEESGHKFQAMSGIYQNGASLLSREEIESPAFQDRLVGVSGILLRTGGISWFVPLTEIREIRLMKPKGWGPARATLVTAGALCDGLAIAFFVSMMKGF